MWKGTKLCRTGTATITIRFGANFHVHVFGGQYKVCAFVVSIIKMNEPTNKQLNEIRACVRVGKQTEPSNHNN